MSRGTLLDTGPLVSLLNRRDRYHVWAMERADRLRRPFWTCEPVLAEAFYLLRTLASARRAILQMLADGSLKAPFRLEEQADSIAALLERYADVPMSLADACLVRMSELADDSAIFTLDRDFQIYRRHGRKVIPLLIPREG